ncbi:MAG: MBL fold metallo-hydrolase, partial [Stackebrandtia sp.]
GNGTIAEVLEVEQFWAHRHTIHELRSHADLLSHRAYRSCLALAPDIAEEVYTTRLRIPDRAIDAEHTLDLGGRSVRMWHPGPAHTNGDLVVQADDVVMVGDLVEEGAPPDIDGSDLQNWPLVLESLLPHMTGPVIPGHGDIVDSQYVAQQRRLLARLADFADVGPAD